MRMSYGILRPSGSSDEIDLDHALPLEHAAFADRPRHERDVLDARRRVEQPVARYREPGRVGDRGRLDRRLRAVEEAVEHLRVEAAALGLLGRQAVVAPHGVRRRLAEVRQPLVAAARGGDREAAGARPVDQVADQRRLVAERERVDDARVGGALREQRPAERIRLDRHVDDVLAVARTPRGSARPRRPASRCIRRRCRSPGCATSARQSSPTCVVPVSTACAMLEARARSSLQPTRARLPRAPRRARGRRSRPGGRRACAGSAPGTSSRTCRRRSGRPDRLAARRARRCSCAWRLMAIAPLRRRA